MANKKNDRGSSNSRRPPREHNRQPAQITKGPQAGQIRSGSFVNPGVTHSEEMQQVHDKIRALQDALKDVVDNLDWSRDGIDPSMLNPHLGETVTQMIQERELPFEEDSFITLDSVNLGEDLTPNAIWNSPLGPVPVRVLGTVQNEDGTWDLQLAGSNTLLPLSEVEPISTEDETAEAVVEDEQEEEVLPPPPVEPLPPTSPNEPPPFFDDDTFYESQIIQSPGQQFSYDPGKMFRVRPPRVRRGFWGHAPRIAAGFMGGLAAITGTASVFALAGAATVATPVMTMAFAGGVLAAEHYRRKRQMHLPPQWEDFRHKMGWGKNKCERWVKKGFSPQEALEWHHQFSQRSRICGKTYGRGGTAREMKIAHQFKKMGLNAEQASPFIQSYMTAEDVKVWDKFTNGNPDDIATAADIHLNAAMRNGAIRVPAKKIIAHRKKQLEDHKKSLENQVQ